MNDPPVLELPPPCPVLPVSAVPGLRCSPLWVLQEHLVFHKVFLTERWQIKSDLVFLLHAVSSSEFYCMEKSSLSQFFGMIDLAVVEVVQEVISNIM
ncbi:hypothetical protein N7530_003027 [Penicillium desertorum]|uniref:Uncharacterized protein n=1 Tax=Penicillium desertorum TaxID=1303715 RepID=A0A9W9X4Q3_9EURO|nr:hypothetical protein N7530_003027 [Penicillium desertorum]